MLILALVAACGNKSEETKPEPKPQIAQESSAQKPQKMKESQQEIKRINFEVVGEIPHDSHAYTQGLFYLDGYLYESTGRRGSSSLRKINPLEGEIVEQFDVDSRYFAEGIAKHDGKIYQLTYTSGICFVYNMQNLLPETELSYPGEGWGLTSDGRFLIMSDGSHYLRFMKPDDFSLANAITVSRAGRIQRDLNELEYVNGHIYANVFMRDEIIIINPLDGRVIATGFFARLRDKLSRPNAAEVMNGIAYNPHDDLFYLTGKFWDKIFVVKLSY